MANLEDLAAQLFGGATQQLIAAENPYYTGRDTADQIGSLALQTAARNPNAKVGETALWAGLSGLASGLFGGAGDNYQNTLTDRYNNAALGLSDGKNLPPALFGSANRQKQLFGTLQALEQRKIDQALELDRAKTSNSLKADLLKLAAQNPRLASHIDALIQQKAPGDASAPAPEPETIAKAPEKRTLFDNDIPSVQDKIDARTQQLLELDPKLTPNAALETARFELKGELAADSAAMKQLDEISAKVRQTDELIDRAESYVNQAGDTGGIGGYGGGLQQTAKAIGGLFSSDLANERQAGQKLGTLGAEFIAAARIPGSGTVSDFESKLYERAGVSAGNEPEVNREIIRSMKNIAQKNKEYLDYMNVYREEKGTLRGANEYWQKKYLDKVKDIPLEARPNWQDVLFKSKDEKEVKQIAKREPRPSPANYKTKADFAAALRAWSANGN